MKTIRLAPNINRQLNNDEVHKLHTLIPYCGEGIVNWVIHDQEPVSVACEISESANEEEVLKLLNLAFRHTLNTRSLDENIVFEHHPTAPEDRTDVIASNREIHQIDDGLMVFGPLFAKVVNALDQKFRSIADQFEAEELLVPALIPGEQLNRAGYPRNFPHHIATVNVLPHNLNKLKEFNPSANNHHENFRFSGNYLLPAACLNCYNYFSDKKSEDNYTFTVVAQCSRYEAKRMTNPTRLWNFRMREIVHLGSEESTILFRKRMLDVLTPFLTAINLPVRIAASNDPFFIDHGYAAANYQKSLELKYEILAKLPGNPDPLAIGSLNLHHDYFGKNFNILNERGQFLSSTCTAFGLERWAYWLISRLGADINLWPYAAKEAINI